MRTGLTQQAKNDYPTTDGRPVAETDLHRDLMYALIATLKWWYADEPETYVSGNLLIHYEEGNKRRHVAPDVFVAFNVGKYQRENYLLWEERPLAVAIELTSATTRNEDLQTKFELYRDELRITEYFLFDPREEYLEPSFQGFRLTNNEYRPIRLTDGRLLSKELGLLLERDSDQLRLVDPETGKRLPTDAERSQASDQKYRDEARKRREAERKRREAEQERDTAKAALEKLQRELDELKRKMGD